MCISVDDTVVKKFASNFLVGGYKNNDKAL